MDRLEVNDDAICDANVVAKREPLKTGQKYSLEWLHGVCMELFRDPRMLPTVKRLPVRKISE